MRAARKAGKWTGAYGQKERARAILKTYVRRGQVARLPCADCGSVVVEAHHLDYSDPFLVQWLCRPHHRQRHAKT